MTIFQIVHIHQHFRLLNIHIHLYIYGLVDIWNHRNNPQMTPSFTAYTPSLTSSGSYGDNINNHDGSVKMYGNTFFYSNYSQKKNKFRTTNGILNNKN